MPVCAQLHNGQNYPNRSWQSEEGSTPGIRRYGAACCRAPKDVRRCCPKTVVEDMVNLPNQILDQMTRTAISRVFQDRIFSFGLLVFGSSRHAW